MSWSAGVFSSLTSRAGLHSTQVSRVTRVWWRPGEIIAPARSLLGKAGSGGGGGGGSSEEVVVVPGVVQVGWVVSGGHTGVIRGVGRLPVNIPTYQHNYIFLSISLFTTLHLPDIMIYHHVELSRYIYHILAPPPLHIPSIKAWNVKGDFIQTETLIGGSVVVWPVSQPAPTKLGNMNHSVLFLVFGFQFL